MALWHGVRYLHGDQFDRHDCTPECDEEERPTSFPLPCVRCHGRGCGACASGYTALPVCPFRRSLGAAWEYVDLHRIYPGTLPFSGGLYDQPAPYVVAMRLLDRAKALLAEAAVRRAEREQANG